jgi:release factor glutamine methyltransferase
MIDAIDTALAAGDVAIVTTDTVYGLAALPGTRGYDRIFELKERPHDQALPWLVAGADALGELAVDLAPYAVRLAQMFWPGALTLVVRASDYARSLGQIGQDGTVALRCPDAPLLLEVISRLEKPLACTSANKHGESAASCKSELAPSLLHLAGADLLADRCAVGKPSSIVDCTDEYPVILREGPIPAQVIFDVATFGATLTHAN